MNILYIDHYAGSPEMGMEFRPYYLAREWEMLGHRVRIVGASFSHLRTNNPKVSCDFEVQEIEGIQYQWIKTDEYAGNGAKRAITIFQFCCKLWCHAREIVKDFKPDVVITSSTYPVDTYPAQKIARLANAKLIHENHDLWPLTLETIGGMSKYHPFCLMMGMGLSSAIRNSNHIVCVLPYSYEYFKEYGLKDLTKFSHIPNGIVEEDWENIVDLPSEHISLFKKLEGKFKVGYAGGHALSNALDTLIESASQINDDNIAVVFVGKGTEKERLIQKAKDLNCTNVYFLPPVSKLQVPAILKFMDVVYVGSEKSTLLKYGASLNKLYDYMMAGKPIIYGVDSKNKEILDANCGFVVESQNSIDLKNTIVKLSKFNDSELKQLGKNGKHWVLNNCEYKVLAKNFANLFSK